MYVGRIRQSEGIRDLRSIACKCLCLQNRSGLVLAEHAGDESALLCTLLNQTTDHGGKFGDLCSRPGGKRAVGENPFCYHV